MDTLTKRQQGIIYAASRKCGLSYRSACKRGIDMVRDLENKGYLKMTDNGKTLGRFVFWSTGK
jgi:molybdenum-dependent DNA-binding transcriptional regulator ModE